MAKHAVVLGLFYDGDWQYAPVLTRNGCRIMRGIKTRGDSDPASAGVTIDNVSELYSPRSIASALHGKIGQNTPARLTVDDSVRIVGEAVSWKPGRPIKGSGWTDLQIAGVLQRIGRGKDPLANPAQRTILPLAPLAYYPLTDGNAATSAADLTGGTALAVQGAPALASVPGPGAGDTSHPELIASGAYVGGFTGSVPASTTGEWTYELWFRAVASAANCTGVIASFHASGTYGVMFWVLHFSKVANTHHVFLAAQHDLSTATGFSANGGSLIDGAWHQIRVKATQVTATQIHVEFWVDDVLRDQTTASTWTVGNLTTQTIGDYAGEVSILYPTSAVDSLSVAHVVPWSTDAPTSTYEAGRGYAGETAADRFGRISAEENITATVVGDPAESVAMGPQRSITLLAQYDELARTDDASIFETRDSMGLTMRTGASKLNQTAALTLYYQGDITPNLAPVYGDEGIRNDVTATSAIGGSRRVQQLTGPHNVQLPEDDPQGVGRYATRIDVNPETDDALADAAGWRVNVGTYAGTWYAAITADLDAAPGIADAVAALDIGDLIALTGLPVDEALEVVESIIIGIEEDVPPARRLITFYCVPADPYRVGVLAETSGDTDPILGHLDTDGSTTVGDTAAGAATVSVETPSGPLWTTDSDDFPLDVIAGGQRVSVASVVDYLNANPYFETNAASWTPAGATFVRSTAQFHQGAASGLFTPDGVTATPQLESDLVPATVGRLYRVKAWVRCSAARTIDLYIGFYQAGGALVTASGTSYALTADTWTYIEHSATAPVLTAQTRAVFFEPGTPPGSATLYVDEAMVVDPTRQTFTVQATGHTIVYPIPAGSAVTVQQPIIPTL